MEEFHDHEFTLKHVRVHTHEIAVAQILCEDIGSFKLFDPHLVLNPYLFERVVPANVDKYIGIID